MCHMEYYCNISSATAKTCSEPLLTSTICQCLGAQANCCPLLWTSLAGVLSAKILMPSNRASLTACGALFVWYSPANDTVAG